eukprot:TRINITY_DN90394_c0_g1_i1.p1 TRINITY_DN90394_c0_g1~~TRINITY_DN90394_c0_g1_i1.p1  ORF type:complete len:510 (-),score=76.37 TRINITY_DN90394_c0_g1_i1:112-1641(-)
MSRERRPRLRLRSRPRSLSTPVQGDFCSNSSKNWIRPQMSSRSPVGGHLGSRSSQGKLQNLGSGSRNSRYGEADHHSSRHHREIESKLGLADAGSSRASRDARSRSRGRGGRQPKVVFLMGLPGAGKTTVKRDRLFRGGQFVNVEPDQLKRFHKRYSDSMDEETDTEVHRWSVRRAVDAFEDALQDRRRKDIIFDSSGSNSSWLADRVETAREAGYRVELLWVDVPLEIALLRNRDRASSHGQWCPENIIMDKAKLMRRSFEELRPLADSAERLENWDPNGGELKRAKQDIYWYPAPRSRAMTVRPGDEGYAEPPEGARSPSPSAGSRRTILIGPWKRNDEVLRKKNIRLKWIDDTYKGNRERFVLEEVLAGREIYLENNMFPYHLPPGMEHWTIWSRHFMDHDELCEYIESWLDARMPHNVVAWNYDDNMGNRTIDIWHVHVYFQGSGGEAPKFCMKPVDRGGRNDKACSRHRSEGAGGPSVPERRRLDAPRSDKMLRTPSLRSPCSV